MAVRLLPPSQHGHTGGTAETFDQARSDFEGAWKEYLRKCTEAGTAVAPSPLCALLYISREQTSAARVFFIAAQAGDLRGKFTNHGHRG
jgi:hypothetical protein